MRPCSVRRWADRLGATRDEERLVLDKPLFVPLDRQARLDFVILKVTHEVVQWEGYIMHADVRCETAAIPLSIPEEVTGTSLLDKNSKIY